MRTLAKLASYFLPSYKSLNAEAELAKKMNRREIVARLRLAQLSGNLDEVLHLSRVALAATDGAVNVLLTAARAEDALLATGEMTSPLWEQIFDARQSQESAFHLVSRAANAQSRQRALGKIAKRLGGDVARHIAERAERIDMARRKRTNHVALCGISYCGSTIVAVGLDSHTPIADVGESHWLIDRRLRAGGNEEINFASGDVGAVPFCWGCGKNCAAYSLQFRSEMALYRRDWYQRISERLHLPHIVSRDKNLEKYASFDPELRFHAVIIFKSPKQAWASYLSKLPAGTADEEIERRLTSFTKRWIRDYTEYHQHLSNDGRKIYVLFDRLAGSESAGLLMLARELDLPSSREGIIGTKETHAIGGNTLALRGVVADGGVVIRPLKELDLPDAHSRALDRNEELNQLFDAMRTLSIV